MDRLIRGKCSLCGGVVSVPRVSYSTKSPVASCESCGAVEDEAAHLPTVPMKKAQEPDWIKVLREWKNQPGKTCKGPCFCTGACRRSWSDNGQTY